MAWVYYLSYSLNSLKGVIWGIIYGTTIGGSKGDTRSLDSSSFGFGGVWRGLGVWGLGLRASGLGLGYVYGINPPSQNPF